jgi:large conductance mechanosensitive channel
LAASWLWADIGDAILGFRARRDYRPAFAAVQDQLSTHCFYRRGHQCSLTAVAAVLKRRNQEKGGLTMFKEFRDFAIKGNMIDLAIGVIIGAAFGAIVSSIVDDIFMPLIGLIIGGIDFSNLFIVLSNPNDVAVPSVAAAKEAGVATLNIGLFINAVVKFTIIAFVLFLVVKGINRMKRQAAAEPVATTPAPSKEEVLLTEIRDALRASPR